MRNKLNNKTASKCQRTSPEVVAALRPTICTARGFGSPDTSTVNGQALSSAFWMRRINSPLPAISLDGLCQKRQFALEGQNVFEFSWHLINAMFANH
jgi:hypothetical protein